MFLKATTPTIADTVVIKDAADNEITRFVAIWKRPDSKTRKSLLKARIDALTRYEVAKTSLGDATTTGMDTFSTALTNLEDESKERIRAHLERVDGLLDANDQPVTYSPDVLEAMLEWSEYTNPLAESLARLAEGRTVQEAQSKNSETPEVGGQAPTPVAVA